ncbi:hypothetical protein [Krasilnikovia sp. M28-CT-15]|uniref:hypothetical protein n=1 Tax=Krasilnikovia sp. M28-CT-15 TaxID=3373540 RepID=UPI003876F171
MTPNWAPNHADAKQGVEQRMSAILRDCPGMQAVPLPPARLRKEAALADVTAGRRVRAGATAVNLPPDQVFAAVTEHCRRAGYGVTDADGRDGRLLIARGQGGYLLTLRQHASEAPILIVASPGEPPWSTTARIWAGVATGAAVGVVSPALSLWAAVFDLSHLLDVNARWFAWVPLFIVAVLGCLLHPASRAFGTGLLIGGSVVGVLLSGICTGLDVRT